MPRGAYAPDISESEKRKLEEVITELSSSMFNRSEPERYEFISRQRAILSRTIFAELTELEKISLRVYGHYGLIINARLRMNKVREDQYIDRQRAEDILAKFHRDLNITSQKSISDLSALKTKGPLLPRMRLNTEETINVIKSYQRIIEDTIARESPKFKPTSLYRISRAKKNVYVRNESEAEFVNAAITPGSLLKDNAFISTASDARVAITRYSNFGQKASNPRDIVEDEEEIIFAIQPAEETVGIDISGFKAPKDSHTSGEILLKSNSVFRVKAIQNTERRMIRRVVVLSPVETINPGETIHNPFNGDPYEAAFSK